MSCPADRKIIGDTARGELQAGGECKYLPNKQCAITTA